MDPTTVLIADDHPVFRHGLREIIEESDRFHVVAEADDGQSAIGQIDLLRPDVAILDLSMPARDGFEVAEWIRDNAASVRTVIMTMHNEAAFLQRAWALAVAGYLLKDDAHDQVLKCLAAVARGERYVSPSIGAERPVKHPELAADADAALIGRLTPAQRSILRQVAEYKTSKEIARDLGLSHRTVQNHRTNIAGALGLQGRNRLLEFAVRNKSLL